MEEGDEGMIHSVLSSLPELYEEEDHAISAESEDTGDDTALAGVAQAQTIGKGTDTSDTIEDHPLDVSDDSTVAASVAAMSDMSSSLGDDESTTVGDDPDNDDILNKKVADSLAIPAASSALEPPLSIISPDPTQLNSEPSEKRSLSRASTITQPDELPPRPRISLTSLLMQADELYARLPPSHPSIALASIMGPQSVMLTWSEDPSELPSDDDAELMVTKPELIVKPYIDSDDEVASDDEEKRGKHRGRRRGLQKPRHLMLQRKTMVAGAVLVLGVAVAVYGIQNGSSAGLFRGFAESQQHRNPVGREWKRMSSFVGGLVLGVGERIFEPLWH